MIPRLTNETISENQSYCVPNRKSTKVEIGSLTAEIFLIVTKVARTSIAWTNVTVTVGICSRGSQEPTINVSSKSGQ